MKFQVSKRIGASGREIQDIPLASLQASVNRARRTRPLGSYPLPALISDVKKNGVVTPIMIRADGTIVDGLCRIIAATQAGRATIPAIVVEAVDGPVFLVFDPHGEYLECLARYDLVLEYLELVWGPLGPFKNVGDHFEDGNGRHYVCKAVMPKSSL